MQHIMLDLETLDTATSAAILSIGAVKFDPNTESAIGEKFYLAVDVQSNIDAGRTVSGDTLNWWMGQDDSARAVFKDSQRVLLPEALEAFAGFFDRPDYQVWGNGSDFDNAIVIHAFKQQGWKLPWKFFNNRCYRTLKNLPGVPKMAPFEGKHNALLDAWAQALHLQTFFSSLKVGA